MCKNFRRSEKAVRVQSAESGWGPGWNRSQIQENIEICWVFVSCKALRWRLVRHRGHSITRGHTQDGSIAALLGWMFCLPAAPMTTDVWMWQERKMLFLFLIASTWISFKCSLLLLHQVFVLSVACTSLSQQPDRIVVLLLALWFLQSLIFVFPLRNNSSFTITIFTGTGVKQPLVLMNEMSPCPPSNQSLIQSFLHTASVQSGINHQFALFAKKQ